MIYENNGYKTARTIIHTLADVVSKNGNLLLNVSVRGNGSIDEKERAIIEEIGDWMKINQECIYDTRPWSTFGEGPAIAGAAQLSAQGLMRVKALPLPPKIYALPTRTIRYMRYCWLPSKPDQH